MAIKIKIGGNKEEKKEKGEIRFNLNIRRTLDGNLIIYDHEDIDIMVMPEPRKVLALSSDNLNSDDKIYDTQNRLFKYLAKKGVILPDTVHAGNVYGSMEAEFPKSSEGKNETDIVLMVISQWVDGERPDFVYQKDIEEREIERLTDPPNDETTGLGKIPHNKNKGTATTLGPNRSVTGYIGE